MLVKLIALIDRKFVCFLDDKTLPAVPYLVVRLPTDYPYSSPHFDTKDYGMVLLTFTLTILVFYALLFALAYSNGTIAYTIPYHTIPYHTIPYYTITYHNILSISYHTITYHTKLYHNIHTIPYHTIHTIPYHTIPSMPYNTIPYHTKPYHTIHTIPY